MRVPLLSEDDGTGPGVPVRSRAPGWLLWVIAKHENSRMSLLTVDPGGDGEALAVFSFEEEAEAFLRLGTQGAQWQARRTTTGEIISLLYGGPCASAKRVALDPLPAVGGGMVMDLAGWERFARRLTGEPPPVYQRSRATADSEPSEGAQERRARETGEARTRNGADDVAIPDYVMLDFGPTYDSRDGSRDGSGVRRREE